jgi:hypothetical protein
MGVWRRKDIDHIQGFLFEHLIQIGVDTRDMEPVSDALRHFAVMVANGAYGNVAECCENRQMGSFGNMPSTYDTQLEPPAPRPEH